MATAPVKSQPLHNFSLPFFKWGGQNQTSANHCFSRPMPGDPSRTSGVVSDHNHEPESEPQTRAQRVGSRTLRNRFGLSSCRVEEKSEKQEPSERVSNDETNDESGYRKRETEDAEETGAEEKVQKPWNLRPRKPMFSKSAVEIAVGGSKNGVLQETVATVTAAHSVQQSENPPQTKSLRSKGFAESRGTERKRKRKFWITLTREEIEEDIFIMTGSRPARRPKKRSKPVQKQLDSVFPGLWLVGVTADAYKLAETAVKK